MTQTTLSVWLRHRPKCRRTIHSIITSTTRTFSNCSGCGPKKKLTTSIVADGIAAGLACGVKLTALAPVAALFVAMASERLGELRERQALVGRALPEALGVDLDARDRIHDDHGRVDDAQRREGIGDEVNMSGKGVMPCFTS